jgi:hypothetical protein
MTKSLEYFDRETQAEDWAAVHSNMGNLFSRGVTGNQASDIAAAITEYKIAKSAITEESAPRLFAAISDNLASALAQNPQGDRTKNLLLALDECTQALQLWSFTENAVDRLKASGNYVLIASLLVDQFPTKTLSAGLWRSLFRNTTNEPLIALANSVRDVLDPLDLHYEQGKHDIFFEPSSVHLQLAERLASLVPKLDESLQLKLDRPRDRWLERAQWIRARLQKSG